jgi:hypothetical protein
MDVSTNMVNMEIVAPSANRMLTYANLISQFTGQLMPGNGKETALGHASGSCSTRTDGFIAAETTQSLANARHVDLGNGSVVPGAGLDSGQHVGLAATGLPADAE